MAASRRGSNDIIPDDAPGADLYAVLGLNRECTDAELRASYRRLAMRWHPDRCSASGSSARVEEAKERFQEIQGAYSVLSDSNKRFLYDVGVYDSEDDDAELSGMGDFLGEMADMMSQATPTETFEELQQLFVDMFQDDLQAGLFGGPRPPQPHRAPAQSPPSTSVPPPPPSSSPLRGRSCSHAHAQAPPGVNRPAAGSSATRSAKRPRPGRTGFDLDFEDDLGLSGFCFMVSEPKQRPAAAWASDVSGGAGGERRSGRVQRAWGSRDVSDGGGVARPRQGKSSRAPWQC